MSKSAGEKHYVGLFEDEAGIRRKVKSAVTDSGETLPDGQISPGVSNMFEILRACGKDSIAEQMETEYREAKLRYVDLKGATADALVELTGGLKVKRDEIKKNKDKVKRTIQESSARARDISIETMRGVRKLAGLPQMKY
jgi:tryptophanyl-tRNA synthetase